MNEHDRPDPLSLDARLAALPRDVPPARDLWPGIDGALARGAPRPRRWPSALAAAVALAAFGGLLSIRMARETPPAGAGDHAGPSGSVPVAARPKGAEHADYLATRAALERTYRERLALLAPDTRARIEEDLARIRSAHEDIRQALASDPGSRVLLQLLQSTTEQEFSLYSAVGRGTEPLASRTRT
jgi:hypothetical protein